MFCVEHRTIIEIVRNYRRYWCLLEQRWKENELCMERLKRDLHYKYI